MKTTLFFASTEPLRNPEQFDACYRTVPLFRRQKADRLIPVEEKMRSLGAWLLLSHALSLWGISKERQQIGTEPNGKPFLILEPNVFLNLSHAGDRVFCAVSDCPIGCDVEQIKPFSPAVATRFFSQEEQTYLFRSPIGTPEERFCRIWTLRESFVKAIGAGLSLPASTFSVLSSSGKAKLFQTITDTPFSLLEFAPEPDYRYAVCTPEPAGVGEPIFISPETLFPTLQS